MMPPMFTLCALIDVVSFAYTQKSSSWMHEWDTVAVGHRQTVMLPDKRIVELQTLSTDPPVFFVPSFLSDRSCDDVVGLASCQQPEPSKISGNENEIEEIRSSARVPVGSCRHLHRTRSRLY
eukprot:TRINITY_DN110927_c0_g1_i1.p2 TRINITY_DN110927_c0_g1~~TRINITY_DN110927_c0_g1_i1.p2  ORF type:complete len:122 (-),score=9.58 TRINITY_DN110927_c0_g1_i1:825-1190(-)